MKTIQEVINELKGKIPKDKTVIYIPFYVPTQKAYEFTKTSLETLKSNTDNYFLIIREDPKNKLGKDLLSYADYSFQSAVDFVDDVGSDVLYLLTGSDLPYIVATQHDVYFRKNWLVDLLEAAKDPKVGICSIQASSSWPVVGGMNPPMVDRYVDNKQMNYCNLLFKREVPLKIGYWDISVKLGGGSDADYMIRAINGGFVVRMVLKNFLWHGGGAVCKETMSDETEKAKKGHNYFRTKWRGKETYGFL